MKPWHVILILALCFICFIVGRRTKKAGILRVEKMDTLEIPVPVPVQEIEIGEVEIPYPIFLYRKGDTVRIPDTIYVPVPISRKTYETGDYKAVISGYMPNLESMTLYRKKEVVYEKERRFGIGITAGYGIGRNGLSPYLGIGGYYRIW